jgi:hypothetical protein
MATAMHNNNNTDVEALKAMNDKLETSETKQFNEYEKQKSNLADRRNVSSATTTLGSPTSDTDYVDSDSNQDSEGVPKLDQWENEGGSHVQFNELKALVSTSAPRNTLTSGAVAAAAGHQPCLSKVEAILRDNGYAADSEEEFEDVTSGSVASSDGGGKKVHVPLAVSVQAVSRWENEGGSAFSLSGMYLEGAHSGGRPDSECSASSDGCSDSAYDGDSETEHFGDIDVVSPGSLLRKRELGVSNVLQIDRWTE